MNEEPKNWAKISLKQSSSSGKTGYDVDIGSDGSISQEELNKIAEKVLITALKTETVIRTKR